MILFLLYFVYKNNNNNYGGKSNKTDLNNYISVIYSYIR